MGAGTRGRVLLVEADSVRRKADARALEKAGFLMVSTSVAREALTLATQGRFDVVVCDLDLPDAGGLSLLRRLQEKEVAAAFVALCSTPNNDIAVQAAEAGVLQVLQKPVDPALLARSVAAGVARTRQLLSILKTLMKPSASLRSIAATEAKNEFGNLLDAALHEGAVLITKHDAPKAVLVSADRVSAALARYEPDLQALTQEFDALVARMRTPRARAAARGLFSATPKELGEAAVADVAAHRG